MNSLFLLKAWRDLKKKKLRSFPVIFVILIGAIACIVYSGMIFSWWEVEESSWQRFRYHHLKLTTLPMNVSDLEYCVNQVTTKNKFEFEYEIRVFLEVEVYTTSDPTRFPVHLYAIDTGEEQTVDLLYYYTDTNLNESTVENASVIEKTSANAKGWESNEILKIDSKEYGSFDLNSISYVNSPEYMMAESAAGEFYGFWTDPVIWMRYNDFIKITNTSFVNQLIVHFNNPSNKNDFLAEFLSVINNDLIIAIEGRDPFLSSVSPTFTGMAILMTLVFVSIGAIMNFIVIKRTVEEEKAHLGLFKSLGFNNREVISSAIYYSLLTSLIGSITGSIIGSIINFFTGDFYLEIGGIISFPTQEAYPVVYSIIPPIIYSIFSITTTIAFGLYAGRYIINMSPLEAMKPKIQLKVAKNTLFERITKHIFHIDFHPLTKFSLRSLFQDKRKFFFVVLGITLAVVMANFSAAVGTSITKSMDKQLNYYQNWDVQANFNTLINTTQLPELMDKSNISNLVDYYESGVITPIRFKKDRTEMFIATGLEENTVIRRFDNSIKPVDNKLIITKDLAIKFNCKVGQEISIYDNQGNERILEILSILNEMQGKGIYTTIATARSLIGIEGESSLINCIFIQSNTPEVINQQLSKENYISRVLTKQELKELLESVDLIIIAVASIALIIGLLTSIAILVTIVSISISERQNDFVNFRALGVSNREIFRLIASELVLTSCLGIIIGLIGGSVLVQSIFEWAAYYNVVIIYELDLLNLVLIFLAVIVGITLSTYVSLRTLFKTTIAESTVSRMIG